MDEGLFVHTGLVRGVACKPQVCVRAHDEGAVEESFQRLRSEPGELAAAVKVFPGLPDSGEIGPPAASAASERRAVAYRQLAARDGHDGLPRPEAREAVRAARFGQEQGGGAGRVAGPDQTGRAAPTKLVEAGK